MARTELIAVDHAIRITVYASAGTLGLTSHLSVTLPIRVLSMLSVDPPTAVSLPSNMITATHTSRPEVVNGLCLHLSNSGSGNRADFPPSYRTRPPSLEHPQDGTVSDCNMRRQRASVISFETNTSFRKYCHITNPHRAPGVLPQATNRRYTSIRRTKYPT